MITIIGGDLNCDTIEGDVVLGELKKGAFKNSFFDLFPNKKTFASHKSHKFVDVPADHILFRGDIKAISGGFYPLNLDDQLWSEEIDFSDHRPILSTFTYI